MTAVEPEPAYCPDHGVEGDSLRAWPCPVAVEGDPPDAVTCPHFVAELERRLDEVVAGHYFMHYDDERGHWSQEYRNHQPHGEPKLWRGWPR